LRVTSRGLGDVYKRQDIGLVRRRNNPAISFFFWLSVIGGSVYGFVLTFIRGLW
jgi:hypothetical protein